MYLVKNFNKLKKKEKSVFRLIFHFVNCFYKTLYKDNAEVNERRAEDVTERNVELENERENETSEGRETEENENADENENEIDDCVFHSVYSLVFRIFLSLS